MACPDLRATQGPEEEVGSLARVCARFVPNFGPRSSCPTSQGQGAPQGDVQQGTRGPLPPRRGEAPSWSEMDQFAPKRAVSTSEAPWVEFRDGLSRNQNPSKVDGQRRPGLCRLSGEAPRPTV